VEQLGHDGTDPDERRVGASGVGCNQRGSHRIAGLPGSVTFAGVGANTWTVPAGVTSIGVDASGAQGSGTLGGLGGRVLAIVPVTPGEALTVEVGGTDGTNGGGSLTR
jgi:hypothetical protein